MGLEKDQIFAGSGDDTIWAGYGDDVDGGIGNDVLRLSFGGATAGVIFSSAGITGGTAVVAGGIIKGIETLAGFRGSEFGDWINIATLSSSIFVEAGGGDDILISNGISVHFNGGAATTASSTGSPATFRTAGTASTPSIMETQPPGSPSNLACSPIFWAPARAAIDCTASRIWTDRLSAINSTGAMMRMC